MPGAFGIIFKRSIRQAVFRSIVNTLALHQKINCTYFIGIDVGKLVSICRLIIQRWRWLTQIYRYKNRSIRIEITGNLHQIITGLHAWVKAAAKNFYGAEFIADICTTRNTIIAFINCKSNIAGLDATAGLRQTNTGRTGGEKGEFIPNTFFIKPCHDDGGGKCFTGLQSGTRKICIGSGKQSKRKTAVTNHNRDSSAATIIGRNGCMQGCSCKHTKRGNSQPNSGACKR